MKKYQNDNAFSGILLIIKCEFDERSVMRYLKIFICAFLLTFGTAGINVLTAQAKDEPDVQPMQQVGTIVSVDPQALTFEMEYETDDPTRERKTSTFFVTDITTIDIAMTQGSLNDLQAGANVLVEYAPMPDGTRVVESVWVKEN
jgi:hypothetical protein